MNKYTKESLEKIIAECNTWADVCRKFNVKPMTGAQSHIKKRAIYFNIDFSHFVGKSSTKGKTFKKKNAIEYCYKGSTIKSHRLKLILVRDGYKKYICEECNINEWNGEELPLELDHIDGDHTNNELSNLKILCPNCHAIKTRKDRRKNADVAKMVDVPHLECGVK
jgi:Zn finger protein HypA/HybF involved in hydrogenase expression